MKDCNGQRSKVHPRSNWGRLRRRTHRPRQFRPGFETLEGRIVLTTPLVVSLDPAPSSHDASTSTDVAVVFDQPIQQSTATEQTFVVHGLQSWRFLGTLGSVATSESAAVMTPGLGVDFHAGGFVQATVTSGIRNPGGESADPTVWQFRIKPNSGSGFFSRGQTVGVSSTVSVAFGIWTVTPSWTRSCRPRPATRFGGMSAGY